MSLSGVLTTTSLVRGVSPYPAAGYVASATRLESMIFVMPVMVTTLTLRGKSAFRRKETPPPAGGGVGWRLMVAGWPIFRV